MLAYPSNRSTGQLRAECGADREHYVRANKTTWGEDLECGAFKCWKSLVIQCRDLGREDSFSKSKRNHHCVDSLTLCTVKKCFLWSWWQQQTLVNSNDFSTMIIYQVFLFTMTETDLLLKRLWWLVKRTHALTHTMVCVTVERGCGRMECLLWLKLGRRNPKTISQVYLCPQG